MEDNTKDKNIIPVEARPIITKGEKTTPAPKGNIKIGKVGKLTLNVFIEPIKKHYLSRSENRVIHFIIDIALAIIILILLGSLLNLLIFSRYKKVNLIEMKVVFQPAELINGQSGEFTISYTNTTNDSLSNVILVLKTPPSMHTVEFEPKDFDSKTNTLIIGDLASKAHGQFTVKGFLLGNFNDKQEILTVLNYKNKYGQDRQEFFSQNFQLSDSVLKTEIQLPSKIIATSPFTTKIAIKNDSLIDFDKLKIKMIWPNNFSLQKTDLDQVATDNFWSIGQFKSGQTADYTFTGRVNSNQLENQAFQAEIWATYDKTEYLIIKKQNTAPLEFSQLKLGFINTEKNFSISPGSSTSYTLHYKNEEKYALDNLELGLNLNGEFAAEPRQIIFKQKDYPQFSKIEPGEEGSIEVTIKTKQIINFSSYQENGYQLEAKIFATYDDPEEKSRISIESSPFYTIVDSRLSLSTLGLFYTSLGDQIGVGSVPPVVDEYTSYWIIIKVNNTINKIKDLKLTAKVPAGIEFTNINNVSAGNEIIFNENSHNLEWSVDSISAFAGISSPAPEARIQLAITPATSQIGTSPALLTNISATATDAVTGAFITASGKDITIAIFPDPRLNKVIE